MGIVYKLMKHQRKLEMLEASAAIDRKPQSAQEQKFTAEHILQLCKFLAEKSKRNKQLPRKQRKLLDLECSAAGTSVEVPREAEFMDMEVAMEVEVQTETETETSASSGAAALPLVKHSRLRRIPSAEPPVAAGATSSSPTARPKQVLTAKIVGSNTPSVARSTLPLSSTPPASCPTPQSFCQPNQPNQQSSKRDILQKIRSQILERKRQRQLAKMQRLGGVWRPW